MEAIQEMINEIKSNGYDQAGCFREFIKTLEGMIQEVLRKKKGRKEKIGIR